ncbi:MAG: hypothetical protein GIX00_00590 [Candidatus Eremiobacteraeota bacterium]|nr:hypothetical protein [Candidatus Eremiobacteraeota bacterium]MBC5807085.1 hypothetical protein [Candidatus Eremiobacteraeota bacterium]
MMKARAGIGATAIAAALFLTSGSRADVAGMDAAGSLQAQLTVARNTLLQHFREINDRSGLAPALQERIDSDVTGVAMSAKPAWMDQRSFVDYNTVMVRLDQSIVDQLASGRYHDIKAVRGADDLLMKSPVDGSLQPVAVYVPPSYDASRPVPLVVFLHGRTASENDVIASPTVRAAADATHAIVVAPYARGDSQYVDPASVDVYAALDLAAKSFNIDRKSIYLAGHSMGGYGVFIVGPKHPEDWSGVMAVSGGMVTETANDAIRGFAHLPLYLVVGSEDQIVPKGYMKKNADLLSGSGLEAHYYEQPGGRHAIDSLAVAFQRAWHDMLSRHPMALITPTPAPAATGAPNLGFPSPSPAPGPTLHT